MSIIDSLGNSINKRPGVPCLESKRLAEVLSDGSRELFTYEELSAAIGADVQGAARGYLLTARDIVLREKKYVFRAIRNVGLRRVSGEQVTKLDDRTRHIRRTAKKDLREQETVDLESVSAPARISCIARMGLAHMTIHTHQDKQIKKLEAAVGSERKIDLSKTLAAFKQEEA